MVEHIVAIDVTRLRFPTDAMVFSHGHNADSTSTLAQHSCCSTMESLGFVFTAFRIGSEGDTTTPRARDCCGDHERINLQTKSLLESLHRLLIACRSFRALLLSRQPSRAHVV